MRFYPANSLSCLFRAMLSGLLAPIRGICGPIRFRGVLNLSLAALLAAGCFSAIPLDAQTAAFSGAVSTLGGGFTNPAAVAVDASGNIYVADSGAKRVTEMPAGCASSSCVTSLGGGFLDPAGVAVDASGNIYVSDSLTANKVYEMPAGCSSAACVTSLGGGFNEPKGIAVDASGNVYVGDYGNGAVKEIPASCIAGANNSTCVTTLGGAISEPYGVAVDTSGNVYAASFGSSAMYEIPSGCASSTCMSTLGGGFDEPFGVAVDASGNIYTVESAVDKVLLEMPSGCASSSCVSTLGVFNSPVGVAVDGNDNAYVASVNGNVYELQRSGVNFGSRNVGSTSGAQTFTFTFGTGGQLGSLPAVLTQGIGGLDFNDAGTGTCTTNGTGHAYSAGDTCTVDVTFSPGAPGMRLGAVELTNSGGSVMTTVYIYGTGIGPQAVFPSNTTTETLGGSFTTPVGIAVDTAGDVFTATLTGHAVKEIPVSCIAGANNSSCVSTLGGGFANPKGVAVDGAGNVYVADLSLAAIKEIPPGCASSSCVLSRGGGFSGPDGVAVDGGGNVYVSDTNNNDIKEIPAGCTSSSCVVTLVGGFNSPDAIAIDGNGNLYEANSGDNTVREIPAGCRSTSCDVTLGGGFNEPSGVAVDPGGDVYVGDAGNDKVKVIPVGCTSSSCVVTLLSGLNGPVGVGFDGSGNLYFGNAVAGQVKEIPFATPPSLSFTTTDAGLTSTDSPKSATVANHGNATLTFTLPTTGNNPSVSANFGYDNSSTCTQTGTSSATAFTLAAAASCKVAVDFAPTTSGSISGSVVLTDDSLNANPSTTQTISLSGSANSAVTATTVIPVKTVTTNVPVSSFTPVTGSGGTGSLTYSVSPTLPAGLALSTSTGAVTGLPTASSSAATYTVTVTDTLGETATATFSLAVDGPVSASTAISPVSLTQNHAAAPVIPVTGSNGTSPLSYSVLSPLPAGLSMVSSTGALSGTPTAVSSITPYAVVVTDQNGATATASFLLTVNPAVATIQATPSVVLTQNVGAAPITPIIGAGGTGALTYSVSPSLPFGLIFTSSTGTVIGTPTATSAPTSYVVTVTDANGATATNSFTLAVAAGTVTTASNATAAYSASSQNLTLSATVTTSFGIVNEGTVSFQLMQGSNPIGTAAGGTVTNGSASVSYTLPAGTKAGSYTIQASYTDSSSTFAASSDTSHTLTVTAPNYVVTTSLDDAGIAGNCTVQTSTNSGTDASCSLRDALLAAANAGGASIYFDSTKFASATTITLGSAGLLADIEENVTITGPGANLLTISGAHAHQVMKIGFSSSPSVAISGVTIANGVASVQIDGGQLAVTNCAFTGNSTSSSNGGAIYASSSTLTVSGCTFSANSSGLAGGAIISGGALTITNSTFNGNTAQAAGAISISAGSATISNSTFSGNSATTAVGGAIDVLPSSTLTANNNVFAGNIAKTHGGGIDNVSGTVNASYNVYYNNLANGTVDNCNSCTSNSNPVTASSDPVASLGNYGGATQTMLPLPGSAAICAGSASAAATAGLTTDQRGEALTLTTANASTYTGAGGYCPAGSVDAGAVQTDYALSFTTEPVPIAPATAIIPNANFQAGVTLNENGSAFTAASESIPLTLSGSGTLSNGTASTSSGVASYSTLQVNAAGRNDTLTANLALNSGVTPPAAVSAISSQFNVTQATPSLSFTPSPASQTYGTAISAASLNATATYNSASVAGAFAYTATVNGSTVTLAAGTTVLPAGNYTITATFTPSDGASYVGSSTTASYSVTAVSLTASVTAGNKTYDGSNTATITGCTLSGVIAGDTGNVTCSATGATFATKNAGAGIAVTATGIGLGGSAAGNYTLASATATTAADIARAPLTITATANSKTYDSTTSAAALPTVGAGQLQGSDSVTGLLEVYSTASAGTAKTLNVSAFTVIDGNSGNNYQVTDVPNTSGIINGATVTAAVTAGDKTYNGSNVATITGCTLSGVIAADTGNVTCSASGATFAASGAGNSVTATATGISLGGGAAGNYTLASTIATTTANITEAALTVTASNSSTTYGTAPSVTPSYSAFAGSETAASLTTAPTCSSTITTATGVGSYTGANTCTGGVDANYSFTYVAGNASVTQAAQTIHFSTPTSPVFYGVAPIALSATATSGVAPDFRVISGPGTISGSTLTITGAGSIVIAANQAGNTNYTAAAQVTQTVTVHPVALTITASGGSMVYGGTLPAITASYAGFVNGDSSASLTAQPSCSTTASIHSAVGSYPSTCTGAADSNYTISYTAGTVSVTNAALTIVASNAARIYGTANPVFTGSIVGALNGDTFTESFSTAAAISSAAGSYAIVPAATGANLADYTQTITSGTLAITQAPSSTTVGLSSTAITPGQSETITATVASTTTGTPTGTVSFYDGATLLNTATLSGGVASFSTTTLASGITHSITVTYSGDANFLASTSGGSVAVINVAPLDFTMTIAGPSTSTVIPGQSVTYQATVTPLYGSFAGTVSFAVAGLPPGATVAFSPSSIPANSGPQTVTVTITTARATAMLRPRRSGGPPSGPRRYEPVALGLLLLVGGSAMRKGRKALRRSLSILVLLGAGAAATIFSGCGGHAGFFSQAPQNYTVTLTATAGSLQHSTTLTINVQ